MNTQRRTVDLVRGTNVFRFTPPPDLPPGLTLADLRVLTPGGQVITWASGYYQTTPPVEIAAVELEKTILPPGAEPVVRGRVKLSAEAAAGDQLEVLAWDLHDRLVGPKDVRGGGRRHGVRGPAARRAVDGPHRGGAAQPRQADARQAHRRPCCCCKRRTWDPKECCQYEWYSSPIQGWTLPYLYDLGRRRAGLIGATSLMDNPLFARLDLEAGAFTAPLGIWDMSDRKYHEKSNAYARTKDRQLLVREPCLWDPAYRAKAGEAMRRAARTAMAYGGGYAYCLGDEMSLTSYNAYYDFDFSPASVAAYRGWLAKRYGTLEALNRQWETAYRDWAADRADDRRRGPPARRRQLRPLGRLPHLHGRLPGRLLRLPAKVPGGGRPAGQDQHLRHPGRHGRQQLVVPVPAGASSTVGLAATVSGAGRVVGVPRAGRIPDGVVLRGVGVAVPREHEYGRPRGVAFVDAGDDLDGVVLPPARGDGACSGAPPRHLPG